MFRPEESAKIDQELENAHKARQQGLEGRARVCARRAAGVAIRAYLDRRGILPPGPSAMDVLAYYRQLPEVSAEQRQIIDHLLARVDESFALPAEVDLLAEVRRLVDEFEQDTGEVGI